MGVRLAYGTAGATGGGYADKSGAARHCFEEGGALVRPGYSWQRRSAMTWADRNAWISGWPTPRTRCGGGGNGWGTDGMCGPPTVGFEPFSCDGEGTQTLKWILGQCLDASGNAAAGAIVQAFRTSDDAFAGEVNSNSTDGRFAVPSPFPGVNHYLVAYKPGAPDTGGTTVNTLTPTNIDGT